MAGDAEPHNVSSLLVYICSSAEEIERALDGTSEAQDRIASEIVH